MVLFDLFHTSHASVVPSIPPTRPSAQHLQHGPLTCFSEWDELTTPYVPHTAKEWMQMFRCHVPGGRWLESWRFFPNCVGMEHRTPLDQEDLIPKWVQNMKHWKFEMRPPKHVF
eukprot:GEMP01053689.1.p2 GENE.GEMP01053689.1~~GEMP01053689.1.p2  ORF type:complete len:114 (+),score=13.03 GEMP01053689.1:157-498(+)